MARPCKMVFDGPEGATLGSRVLTQDTHMSFRTVQTLTASRLGGRKQRRLSPSTTHDFDAKLLLPKKNQHMGTRQFMLDPLMLKS